MKTILSILLFSFLYSQSALAINFVYGNSGNNTLYGNDGEYDVMYGYAGNDTLIGGLNYESVMYGGAGNDNFWSSYEDNNEYMIGGSGDDFFKFVIKLNVDFSTTPVTADWVDMGNDRIEDFNSSDDSIHIILDAVCTSQSCGTVMGDLSQVTTFTQSGSDVLIKFNHPSFGLNPTVIRVEDATKSNVESATSFF